MNLIKIKNDKSNDILDSATRYTDWSFTGDSRTIWIPLMAGKSGATVEYIFEFVTGLRLNNTLKRHKTIHEKQVLLASGLKGLVVSVLYCFTSQEVKDAIIRRWYMHWEVMRINREIISRRQSRDSQLGGGIFANLHDRLINSNSNHNQSRKDQVLVHNHMTKSQPKYDQPRPSVDHGFYSVRSF